MSMHSNLLRRLFLAIALTISVFCSLRSGTVTGDPPPEASHKEWNEGWKDLFDGKSTRGWRLYGSKKPIRGWKVIDGALVRVEPDAGNIITNEQFDQFELEFDSSSLS